MEYLVTMTTRVPAGTPERAVDDVRAREAAHSRELAAQGHLLRLWRPPLRPGEWRSFGLFAAADPDELERVLASMPLRIWRTDEVTALEPHPNDPVPRPAPGPPEFLTAFTLVIPDGTPGEVAEDGLAREAVAARELGRQGHLLRLWRVRSDASDGPGALGGRGALDGRGALGGFGALGGPGALGLWRAADLGEMQAIVKALPLDAWMTTEITPLSTHPSDPVLASS